MTRHAPPVRLDCPRCGAGLAHSPLLSGNTFGAIPWTDGALSAHMLPIPDALARCPVCRGFFWREGVEPRDEPGTGPGLPTHLGVEDIVAALDAGVARGLDDERGLRLLLWRRRDDPARTDWRLDLGCAAVLLAAAAASAVVAAHDVTDRVRWIALGLGAAGVYGLVHALRARRSFACHLAGRVEWRPELEALLRLLREDDPLERLCRAELLRQLGRFEEALAALPAIEDDATRRAWAAEIRAGIEARHTLPRPFEAR